jgi:SCP-2 sterol transfer family protein
MPRAQDLIATAYRRLTLEAPAFDRLKLVVRLELRGRGDVQVFRVRTPGPEIKKEDPQDARLEVSIPRSHFNELAEEGKLKDWREAYEHGHIKVSGDRQVQRLIGELVSRHDQRARTRKVH